MAAAIYHQWARLWPLLSPAEDYQAQCRQIERLLSRWLDKPAAGRLWSVLELGSGAGHSVVHLKRRHQVTAVDLSEQMLELSRRINPEVEHVQGDMRSLALNRRFDAVLLHDSIDYMTTREDATRTLATARRHLRPGGVVVLTPTYLQESFSEHEHQLDGRSDGEIEVACVSYVRRGCEAEQFELVLLLIVREEGRMWIEQDTHACGLFSRQTWVEMIEAAGFECVVTGRSSGSGHVFVGRR